MLTKMCPKGYVNKHNLVKACTPTIDGIYFIPLTIISRTVTDTNFFMNF